MSDDPPDDTEDELANQRRLRASGRTGPTMLSDRLTAANSDPRLARSTPGIPARCSECDREHPNYRHCPTCEGERNRRLHERTGDAIREYKRTAERDDETSRAAYLQVVELAGKSYAVGLATAIQERLERAPKRARKSDY